MLDGSGSTDADGDALTYKWSIISMDEGLVAELSSDDVVMPTMDFVGYGDYTVQLIVNDGEDDSLPDTVLITSNNTAPVANAGDDRSAFMGETIFLNAEDSYDADGDEISYLWSILEKPLGSSCALDSATTVAPAIIIDQAGDYVLQLVVSDGLADSAPDLVTITTHNSKPIADAGADIETTLEDGEQLNVQLDGTASYDSDGDELSYSWNLVSAPESASAILSGSDSNTPTLSTDMEGTYIAQLIVSDGQVNSDADTVKILVNAPVVTCDTSLINQRALPVIIRDFKSSHADFEQNKFGEDYEIVEDDLGEDSKPVYASGRRGTHTTNGPDKFNQWYNTVSGVNKEISMDLVMSRDTENGGNWIYDSNEVFGDKGFFPIDGMGYGNYRNNKNYHFTLETHLEFAYQGGEQFTFRGDDDLYLYINGKLAINIGGIHEAIEKTIDLDAKAEYLGIEPGNTYSFDLFFAERQTVESNFRMETNINLECGQEEQEPEQVPGQEEEPEQVDEDVFMAGGGKVDGGNNSFGFNWMGKTFKGNVLHLLYNHKAKQYLDPERFQVKILAAHVDVESLDEGYELTAPCTVRNWIYGYHRSDYVCKVWVADNGRSGDKFKLRIVDGPDSSEDEKTKVGYDSGDPNLTRGNIIRYKPWFR